MNRLIRAAAIGAATTLLAFGAQAQTVKIGFIDPLSGLMAPVGQNQLNSWKYIAEIANQVRGKAGAHQKAGARLGLAAAVVCARAVQMTISGCPW